MCFGWVFPLEELARTTRDGRCSNAHGHAHRNTFSLLYAMFPESTMNRVFFVSTGIAV